jgi:hypothetical protein
MLSQIVLGAGANTFSDIRRLRRTSTRATLRTLQILSSQETRGFWIRQSKDGTIEVGRENEDAGFLGWRDPYPLPIHYFAFCTWTGVVGTWLYGCPTNPTEENVTNNCNNPISQEEGKSNGIIIKKNLR